MNLYFIYDVCSIGNLIFLLCYSTLVKCFVLHLRHYDVSILYVEIKEWNLRFHKVDFCEDFYDICILIIFNRKLTTSLGINVEENTKIWIPSKVRFNRRRNTREIRNLNRTPRETEQDLEMSDRNLYNSNIKAKYIHFHKIYDEYSMSWNGLTISSESFLRKLNFVSIAFNFRSL